MKLNIILLNNILSFDFSKVKQIWNNISDSNYVI